MEVDINSLRVTTYVSSQSAELVAYYALHCLLLSIDSRLLAGNACEHRKGVNDFIKSCQSYRLSVKISKKASLYSPEGLFYSPDIVAFPIPLHDFFLTHRHAGPSHPHVSDTINVVLIKDNLLLAHVSFWPLS